MFGDECGALVRPCRLSLVDTVTSTVVAWHDALSHGDIDHLVALSSDDVEVVGPRGSGRGSDVLRDWAGRSGIRLEPRRVFARDEIVVVAQRAEWRSPDTGDVIGSDDVATIFRVTDGRVTSIDRRSDLAEALHLAGLTEADEVRPA
jgi:ketosteroid isomerase-like protein